eukprot:8943413-Prorocentrum_lima.AAC.1
MHAQPEQQGGGKGGGDQRAQYEHQPGGGRGSVWVAPIGTCLSTSGVPGATRTNPHGEGRQCLS